MAPLTLGQQSPQTEVDLISRAVRKEEAAIRSIVRSHNSRLYRIARSIIRDDSEAEDVLQEAYLRAFASLSEFRGESSLATWLTRIVTNEALQRLRRRTDVPSATILSLIEAPGKVIPFPLSQPLDPERIMAQRELCHLLERAIDELPSDFRMVLVARAVENMSVEETADLFGIRPETVKTRLHRARRLLKAKLADQIGPLLHDAFPFAGRRCEELTEKVIKSLSPLVR